MVEILEDVDPNEQVISACNDIAKAGYSLALDDFVFKNELQPLIELADIIKIDFMLTPIDEIQKMVNRFKGNNIKLLAEKIETYEEFEKALSMGFMYFQGYFFSKPGKSFQAKKLHLPKSLCCRSWVRQTKKIAVLRNSRNSLTEMCRFPTNYCAISIPPSLNALVKSLPLNTPSFYWERWRSSGLSPWLPLPSWASDKPDELVVHLLLEPDFVNFWGCTPITE